MTYAELSKSAPVIGKIRISKRVASLQIDDPQYVIVNPYTYKLLMKELEIISKQLRLSLPTNQVEGLTIALLPFDQSHNLVTEIRWLTYSIVIYCC